MGGRDDAREAGAWIGAHGGGTVDAKKGRLRPQRPGAMTPATRKTASHTEAAGAGARTDSKGASPRVRETAQTRPRGAAELRAALGESRRQFVSIGVFSAFVNLLMLTGPLFMLQIYDRVLAVARTSRRWWRWRASSPSCS